MCKLITLLIFFFIVGVKTSAQQNAQYSQYIFNAIYVNPAYAGYKERVNINAFYRNQWAGISGAPKSMSFAVDASAFNDNVGLALQVNTDKLGAQNSLSAFANYAYRLALNEDATSRLAFGLGLGFQQSALDGNLLIGNDVGDNSIPTGAVKELVPDLRAGVYFANKKFYAGFSADNLISKALLDKKVLSFNFPTPKPHLYLMGGAIVPIVAYELEFKPSFLIKDDIKGPTVLDLNAFFLFKQKIWLGAGYRTGVKIYNKPYLQDDLQNSNAIIGMTEIYLSDRFRLGYSYDHSLSRLSGYSGSTHEISIGWYFITTKERNLNFCYF